MYDFQLDPANEPKARLVLAHGAGAGMCTEFMTQMASFLNEFNIEVVRFNFPYMQTMEATGKRRPPDKMDKLTDYYQTLLAHVAGTLPVLPTFIGGKSMGGRVATLILQASAAKGAVALGYPFHPPGKPESLRTAHLQHLQKPLLVVQGERDTFGNRKEVNDYNLSQSVAVEFIPDGDHSFKPRKTTGVTLLQNMHHAATLAAKFILARCD